MRKARIDDCERGGAGRDRVGWVGRWRNGPLRVGHEEPGLAWSRQEHQSHPCSHSASERPFGNGHLMIDPDFNLHGTALHCTALLFVSIRLQCTETVLYMQTVLFWSAILLQCYLMHTTVYRAYNTRQNPTSVLVLRSRRDFDWAQRNILYSVYCSVLLASGLAAHGTGQTRLRNQSGGSSSSVLLMVW